MIRRCALLLGLLGCQPLPATNRADAGVAELTGVRLERIRNGHTVMEVEAPTARLDLDGTHVVLNAPRGRLQEKPGSPAVQVQGAVLAGDVARGQFTLTHARATDDTGRVATTPLVRTTPDGGLSAEGPVRVVGPNFELDAERAVVEGDPPELHLVGPLEGQATPQEGAAPPPR